MKKNLLGLIGLGAFLISFANDSKVKDSSYVAESPCYNEPSLKGKLEATKGIRQPNNLRLYPELDLGAIKIESITDLNNSYVESKTDVYFSDLAKDEFNLQPVFTHHYDRNKGNFVCNVRASKNWGDYTGFFEIGHNFSSVTPQSAWNFFLENNLKTPIGNFGGRLYGNLNFLEDSNLELEWTGNEMGNSGFHPYMRINHEGFDSFNPSAQIGLSWNPENTIKYLRGKRE